MRRFFAIILFGVLLTSCIQEKKFVVGVSQCSQDLWRDEVNRELELEALMKQDIELRIKSVKDNSALQIKDIKDFIADKVDLLVVSPNEADALSDVISEFRWCCSTERQLQTIMPPLSVQTIIIWHIPLEVIWQRDSNIRAT